MKYKPVTRLRVDLNIENEEIYVGDLAWSFERRTAAFQYKPEFLTRRIWISPFNLPNKLELQPADVRIFAGIHGVFNDSLPDGWGRLLLDRRLQKAGFDYRLLTPLDRLSVVGLHGMGALTYTPIIYDHHKYEENHDLDWFVDQVERVQAQLETAEIDALQAAQGGSAGARPKLMIGLSQDRSRFIFDYGQPLEDGFQQWIVKSRSKDDPDEIGREEYAYAEMARAAGLQMTDTHVISTAKGNHLFATRRFDRGKTGRIHMHTASGLTGADHTVPSLNYEQLHNLTLVLTKNHVEVMRLFRHMVFNVLAHNRDDHSKNHAFVMDKKGTWVVSPAYDLTFSSGPGGEHSLSINGEGRQPTVRDMLAVAKGASIKEADAKAIIDEVYASIENWRYFADQVGLSKARIIEIDNILNPKRGL